MPKPENMELLGAFWVADPAFAQLWALQAKGITVEVIQDESGPHKKFCLYVAKDQTSQAKAALEEASRELRQTDSRFHKMQLAEERRSQAGKGWLQLGKLIFSLGVLISMAAYVSPSPVVKWGGYLLLGAGGMLFLFGYWENNRPNRKAS